MPFQNFFSNSALACKDQLLDLDCAVEEIIATYINIELDLDVAVRLPHLRNPHTLGREQSADQGANDGRRRAPLSNNISVHKGVLGSPLRVGKSLSSLVNLASEHFSSGGRVLRANSPNLAVAVASRENR